MSSVGGAYQTLVAYAILGMVTVVYSNRMPGAEIPLDVWARWQMRLTQASADLAALLACRDHLSFGLRRMPRNLYDFTGSTDITARERG